VSSDSDIFGRCRSCLRRRDGHGDHTNSICDSDNDLLMTDERQAFNQRMLAFNDLRITLSSSRQGEKPRSTWRKASYRK